MLLSRKALQRILGMLWLIDGLLQLQPQMFTMNMVSSIMKPVLQGQPGIIEPSLQFIVTQTTLHLTAVNLLVASVQVCFGLGFLLLPDRWVKTVVLASIVWAFIVWYGGEGMSMLLTGQASILTGAPGAVLLYPLLGLAVSPRMKPDEASKDRRRKTDDDGLLSRMYLGKLLAGFWCFATLLQLQPNWWQQGQISQSIGAMIGQGGLNSVLVDPVLQQVSTVTATIEIALNSALIVVFLTIGIGLAVFRDKQVHPFLFASIIVSLVLWYFSQAFGMILTGMATDFNSGLLVVVITLACWPKDQTLLAARSRVIGDQRKIEASAQRG